MSVIEDHYGSLVPFVKKDSNNGGDGSSGIFGFHVWGYSGQMNDVKELLKYMEDAPMIKLNPLLKGVTAISAIAKFMQSIGLEVYGSLNQGLTQMTIMGSLNSGVPLISIPGISKSQGQGQGQG